MPTIPRAPTVGASCDLATFNAVALSDAFSTEGCEPDYLRLRDCPDHGPHKTASSPVELFGGVPQWSPPRAHLAERHGQRRTNYLASWLS